MSFNNITCDLKLSVKGAELEVGQENLYEDPCQEWLDLINQELTSPYYPLHYEPNTICKWNLTTNKGYYISLDFEFISVSYELVCGSVKSIHVSKFHLLIL